MLGIINPAQDGSKSIRVLPWNLLEPPNTYRTLKRMEAQRLTKDIHL